MADDAPAQARPPSDEGEDTRLDQCLEVVLGLARLEFGLRAEVNGDGGRLDALSAGLNMLGEELAASTITVAELEGRVAERTEELQQRNAQLQTLFKELHHRVKNNLQIVTSLLRFYADDSDDPVVREAFSQTAHRVRAMSLVHELLYRTDDDLQAVDLRAYLREVIAQLHRSYRRAAEIKVELDVPELPLHLEQAVPVGLIVTELVSRSSTPFRTTAPGGSGSSCEQVLVNLVVNARDAISGAGEVVVRAANVEVSAKDTAGALSPGGYVRLLVTDSGCGMDEEVVAHLFEPFFTTKPFGQGTGLGLAIAHGIVTQSGGRIDVESEPGRGTTFTLHLPRDPEVARPAPAPAAVPASNVAVGSGAALLVEDEPALRRVFERLLRGQGFEVEAAANGKEALERLAARPGGFRFVLTDIAMPGMNGLELAKQLAAREPGLKVLFMSGCVDEPTQSGGPLAPGSHFLAKPFGAAELAAAVRRLLSPVG